MKWQISELAKLTGISVRTLHYYDSIGLLKPAEIDSSNGYRFYDEKSLEQLKRILYYRELEFPLKNIPEILSKEDKNISVELLERRRELAEKKKRLENIIDTIDSELSKRAKLAPWFDKILRDYNYSGFAHVSDEQEYFCAWGEADYESNKGFTTDSRFHINAVTMPFTAFCILKLYDMELLNPDDYVSKYLPEFAHGDKITIRHLLDTKSGISDELLCKEYSEKWEKYSEEIGFSELSDEMKTYYNAQFHKDFWTSKTFEEIIRAINAAPLKFKPGEQSDSSSLNYNLLAVILERTGRKSLKELYKEHIFEPFEMLDTNFDIGTEDITEYIYDTKIKTDKAIKGVTGIVSTSADLHKWYRGMTDRKFLSSEAYGILFCNKSDISCGFAYNDGHYTFENEQWGVARAIYISFEKNHFSVFARNKAPIPTDKRRIMYYPIKACDDGYVKFEVWEMQRGSAVRVNSIRIFDENAEELYCVQAPENGYIIHAVNNGGIRHASEFCNDDSYFYELDLSEALKDRFDSSKIYIAEVISECCTIPYAQLGMVYKSGGEWLPMYCNVFYQYEMAYTLFMEALRNSSFYSNNQ